MQARARYRGAVFGVLFYGTLNAITLPGWLASLHYIDLMVLTLFASILIALGFNRLALGQRATFVGWKGMIPNAAV